MGRDDLERLTKEQLIELVLKIQRPSKTSRTSSRPPSTDRKARRDKARPGGAKPGHKGHSRTMAETADTLVNHYPDACPCCQTALSAAVVSDLPIEVVSEHDKIDLPPIAPLVERHRRLAIQEFTPGLGRLGHGASILPVARFPGDSRATDDNPFRRRVAAANIAP